jgi:UDP-2,3-diacylglucosamine pyrophosphatase LpxH
MYPRRFTMALSTTYNLLAFSDVHLGSDLVQHARPEAPRSPAASVLRDRDLAALLDWYREHRVGGHPWRLIIGGDFIDFTGMSVMFEGAESPVVTTLTVEEIAHGLGGAADHTLAKLRLVMDHHAPVMHALAAFLRAGNHLVMVPGNHDADWHWQDVQTEFKAWLSSGGGVVPAQIEFSAWFYYEEGVIYLEHGHQYDAYCSHDHVLYPVSPNDPRRTTSSLSDVLVRYVVRPTRGMTEGGHDQMHALDYVRFGLSLGVNGLFALVARFVAVLGAAFELWREHSSAATDRVRQEHERRIRVLGEERRFGVERLSELARLQLPPLTRSLAGIIASLMLDRVLLGLAILSVIAAVVIWFEHWPLGCACGMGFVVSSMVLRRTWLQRESVEPSAVLRERAASVALLFPAAAVVMGHTHLPEVRASAARSTYFNLGGWAEQEASDGASSLRATRTHLVVTRAAQGPTLQLLAWDDGVPRPFQTASS